MASMYLPMLEGVRIIKQHYYFETKSYNDHGAQSVVDDS
jgi:hypothetical protein